MNRNYQREEEFYADKEFCFSYSSLNKLLFSPSLFYKDYILKDREVRTDKHLVEGKLLHCLLFEPENFEQKFNVMPGKIPTESLKRVLKDLILHTDAETLAECEDYVILDSLKSVNLYQSLKADEARLAKVRTDDNESYWKFLSNTNKDTIDQITLDRSNDQVSILKDKKDVMTLFSNESTDFELDDYETHAEKYLSCKLKGLPFGLHGYIDFYSIDHKEKSIVISDLKTTGKTISDFKETVDFYNYWLQAAIYCKLVWDSMDSVENRDDYTIEFKFVVIDKYNQAYVFDVTQDTLSGWAEGLGGVLKAADYHYKERNYVLPYEFLVNKVNL
tara:strand:- start:2478 stop:3473 length:996 start_codon:yes stop_codon:yes gene_type:complete